MFCVGVALHLTLGIFAVTPDLMPSVNSNGGFADIPAQNGDAPQPAAAPAASPAAPSGSLCQWTDPTSGKFFDLTSMAQDESAKGWVVNGQRAGEVYYTNVCEPVTTACHGSGVKAPGIATQFGNNVCVSTLGVMQAPQYSVLGGSAENGIQVKWGGGDVCETKGARTVTLEIQCDRTLSKTKAIMGKETTMCAYTLRFAGPDGCPTSAGGIGGLGGGWTFVIIVLVVFSLYCGCGTLWKAKKVEQTWNRSAPS